MKNKVIYWHLLGWLVYAGYEFLGVFVNSKTLTRIGIWLTISLLLIRVVEFYVCYLVVYPRFLRSGRAGQLAGALTGVVALYIGSRALIEEVIYLPCWDFITTATARVWATTSSTTPTSPAR